MNTIKSHHPKVLPFLFLTEMWERFGFYMAQGLLVLYVTEYFGFSDDISYTISGIFGGLVYISPFVGGLLADKFLGFKIAILWGGVFLILGYLLLALSSSVALFYPALATIIVGNGLFKPNISSLLGTQYKPNDPGRDSGFTIFYVGINLGVAFSGLSGYVRDYLGWHITFALAAIGMVIGVLVFCRGLKYIDVAQKTMRAKHHFNYQLPIYCALAIVVISFLFKLSVLADWLLPSTGIVLLIFLSVLTLKQDAEYKKKLLILNSLIISSVVFWMLYFQMFNSINLFIERLVDKHIFGLHLTSTVFYALEGVFIILLGPLFAWLWQALGDHRKNPSSVNKFVLGILFLAMAFSVLTMSTLFQNDKGLINPLWVFFSYLLITIGELFLSPIGLSAVTQLAPPHLVGMMMGAWFAALGFGGFFAGTFAKLASVPETAHAAEKLMIYKNAFLDYAYIAFFLAVALFFLQMGLKKLLKIQQQ